ncbi:MAG: hypothetical protein R6V00_12335 [Candidatus Aminicenantes bacterium]
MKKSAVIFFVLAFIQFITVPAFTSGVRLTDSDHSTVKEFSLKTDYSSQINMKKAFFAMGESWAKEAGLIQESAEGMSLEEEIASLKKKRTGFLLGSIALFAAAGVCVWRFTEVEPTQAERPGIEGSGGGEGTIGMGKVIWVTLGAISGAIGVVLISNYSKTNKAIKAKEKELESLSQAQQKLAQALNK